MHEPSLVTLTGYDELDLAGGRVDDQHVSVDHDVVVAAELAHAAKQVAGECVQLHFGGHVRAKRETILQIGSGTLEVGVAQHQSPFVRRQRDRRLLGPAAGRRADAR